MLFLESIVNIKDGGDERIAYIKEDKFVAILRSTVEETELSSFLYSVVDELNEDLSLAEFDELVARKIREKNLPPTIDFACGFLKNGRFYLKTINKGIVLGKRGKEVTQIIGGNKSAAGYVRKKDLYVFTFEGFDKEILEDLGHRELKLLKEGQTKEEGPSFIISSVEELEKEERFFLPTELSGYKLPKFLNNKTAQFLLAGVVLLALIFSVYSGYRKRQDRMWSQKKIEVSKKIESLLSNAEEEAYFSPNKAQEYFSEAEKELQEFKISLPKNKKELAEDLEKVLSEKRKEIFKETVKDLEEVFDLNLIDKGLEGKLLAFSNSSVFILTKNNRIIFVDLETKKSEELEKGGIGNISFLASFDGKAYAFSDKGIFEVKKNEKPELLVEPSENWGKIVDFKAYGKNFYLLDLEKKQVLKHTPIESGYSDAIEYLKSTPPNLSSLSKMAIDGSIFIASADTVYKYYQGIRQDFSLKLPVEEYNFDFIYTNKDLNFLYLLDKNLAKIYVVNKESGDLEEQISNKVFSKASGFFVYKGKIYVMAGDKLYSLE